MRTIIAGLLILVFIFTSIKVMQQPPQYPQIEPRSSAQVK